MTSVITIGVAPKPDRAERTTAHYSAYLGKFIAALVLAYGAHALGTPASAWAACATWDISGDWQLAHSNGWNVFVVGIEKTGNTFRTQFARGIPIAGARIQNQITGALEGTISGNKISFTIPWSNGAVGVYTGVISDQGTISGTTVDKNSPANKANWSGNRFAKCIVASAPQTIPQRQIDILGPAPTPAAPAPGTKSMTRDPNIVTAKNDVDVYNSPVGSRRVVNMMRKGTTATSLQYHQDGWCELRYPIVGPTVTGWVAMDHLSGTCKGQ